MFLSKLPSNPPLSPQVPQRMEADEDTQEDGGGGDPGVWGSWGPWSACSRSCSGGVMEQTRPCLPRAPAAPPHVSAGSRVVSALRASVPLHRPPEPRAPTPPSRRPAQPRSREAAADRRYQPAPVPVPFSVPALLCAPAAGLPVAAAGCGEEFLAPLVSLMVWFILQPLKALRLLPLSCGSELASK